MKRRDFIKIASAGTLSCMLQGCLSFKQSGMANRKPNIVFILADDLGWRDIGCYGSEFYETPNLDRLAAGGMRFTQAYAASPVCSPTRASIMSGKYPAAVRITEWIGGCNNAKLLSAPYIDHLPLSEQNIARMLKDAGYATWHIGKWHLGDKKYWPDHQGFDVNIGGTRGGMPDTYFSPYNNPALRDGPTGEYLTDRLTNEAVMLIEQNDGRPFFLNLWHFAVHIPIQAKAEYIKKYKIKAAALGLDNKDPLRVGDDGHGEFYGYLPNKQLRRRIIQSDPVYASMIQSLDESVGKIMQALEQKGIADNTIIIFTSDNGGVSTSEGSPTCNLPLAEGKGWLYEGGIREPLIINWPCVVKPGTICNVPVTSPDFYSTLLAAAGPDLVAKQHSDGVSIMPLLRGHDKLDREALFWHYPHYSNQGGRPACAVRAGDYKLIEFFEDNHVELYNLRADISETNNLAQKEPQVVHRLKKMLNEWMKKVDAKIPQPNSQWEEQSNYLSNLKQYTD
jgi:arylsulfatase A-like enzyme